MAYFESDFAQRRGYRQRRSRTQDLKGEHLELGLSLGWIGTVMASRTSLRAALQTALSTSSRVPTKMARSQKHQCLI